MGVMPVHRMRCVRLGPPLPFYTLAWIETASVEQISYLGEKQDGRVYQSR